jgi:hypothetical protein
LVKMWPWMVDVPVPRMATLKLTSVASSALSVVPVDSPVPGDPVDGAAEQAESKAIETNAPIHRIPFSNMAFLHQAGPHPASRPRRARYTLGRGGRLQKKRNEQMTIARP